MVWPSWMSTVGIRWPSTNIPLSELLSIADPPALVEAQQQVSAGDQRVRHAQVGAQVAADDHVAARGEAAFGLVSPNRQHWLGGSIHQLSAGA